MLLHLGLQKVCEASHALLKLELIIVLSCRLLLHLLLPGHLLLLLLPVILHFLLLLCVSTSAHHHLHEHVCASALGPHGFLVVSHQVLHHPLLPLVLVFLFIVLFLLISLVMLLLLFITVVIVELLFDVLEFSLEIRFFHSVLLSLLHLPRPVMAIVFLVYSGRFLGLFKGKGGTIVAKSRLKIDEQGPWESLLCLVCLIVENGVSS